MTSEQAQQCSLYGLCELHGCSACVDPPCRVCGCSGRLRCARAHEPRPPCAALRLARSDGAGQVQLHLCDQGVGVAAVVAGDHGCSKNSIPSAALPRSRLGAGGGWGCWSAKKKPAVAGYVEKKTPPLRPSLADGDNGGVFNVAGGGRLFHRASPGARHLSGADVPSREQSGRLARQVQPGRGQRLCSSLSFVFSCPLYVVAAASFVCWVAAAGQRGAQGVAAPARRQPR